MSASGRLLDLRPDLAAVGRRMYRLVEELYPICRSITGPGFRQTLDVVGRYVPVSRTEVPTGTPVFDWVVPREWRIRDAYVKDPSGRKVIDFQRSNLHVVGYSVPVRTTASLAELKAHLHTLPDHPDRVPYRTSFYRENWGFCLAHEDLERLPEGSYEVFIDADLEPGHLTYGEVLFPGRRSEEVLLSCHACHPSLCNDNLSGISLAVALAEHLATAQLEYSYRVLFIPGTIGSITWLSRNEDRAGRIAHGLVLTNVGDGAPMTYKRSRRGDAEVDRVAEYVLRGAGRPYRVLEFFPHGYDERQYCSPGFDLPVGTLMRSQYGTYPEYHTSADDLSFVTPEALGGSFASSLAILATLDANGSYVNTNPRCEPQLGRRGVYEAAGGLPNDLEMAVLWVLNLSDGRNSLLDIASRSGLQFPVVRRAADLLTQVGLLVEATRRR